MSDQASEKPVTHDRLDEEALDAGRATGMEDHHPEDCEVCAEYEDCECEDPDDCWLCGGTGQYIPEHCCHCGGSPYCVGCSTCGAGSVGSCRCPVEVQFQDGVTRVLP